MAEKLGEALLDLNTNDKGLRKGIDRAGRDATGLGVTFDDVSRKAKLIGVALGAAALVGATALVALARKAANTADEMSKSAQRAGVTTEELSRLAWAGELSDVSLGSLTTSMGRLSMVMSQMASGGAKDTKAIFDKLGISVTDSEGRLRSVAEIIPELADRFAAMENGPTKTALAIQLLGRSGAEMIPLLNMASAGLKDAADESDRLGKTISTTAGQDAEHFNDTLTRIGAVVDGLALKVGIGLIPQLQEFANKLADPAFAANAQALAQGVVGFINLIVDAISAAGTKLSEFGKLLEWMSTHDWSTGSLDPAKMDARQNAAMASLRGQLGRGQTSAPSDSFLSSIFGTPGDPATPGATGTGTGDFSSLFSNLGASAAAAKDPVDALLESLRAERDTLRETDPVQQRLIGMRDQLAKATGAQRAEVESLITTIQQEGQAWESAQAAGQFFGDQMVSSLEGLRKGTKSLTDVVNDMIDALAQAVLQSMLLGQGPLSGVFGTSNAGGGLGGLLGSLFSGFHANGGLIPNGTFGIVGERGPEPVISTSQGAQVLPNSSLADMMTPAAASGPMQVIVQGSGLTQSELTQAIADAFENFSRHTLPRRVNEITADPLARG